MCNVHVCVYKANQLTNKLLIPSCGIAVASSSKYNENNLDVFSLDCFLYQAKHVDGQINSPYPDDIIGSI